MVVISYNQINGILTRCFVYRLLYYINIIAFNSDEATNSINKYIEFLEFTRARQVMILYGLYVLINHIYLFLYDAMGVWM